MSPSSVLIDSHILIWILYKPELLSDTAKQAIEVATEVSISQVSFWELALKHQKGKLLYTPEELLKGADVLGLKRIGITDSDIIRYSTVKLPQGDPFDRMILAQALSRDLTLVTADTLLKDSQASVVFSGNNQS